MRAGAGREDSSGMAELSVPESSPGPVGPEEPDIDVERVLHPLTIDLVLPQRQGTRSFTEKDLRP
jgi:hypothetical protein